MMLAQEECKLCIATIACLELGVLGPEGGLLFRLVNLSSSRQAIEKVLHLNTHTQEHIQVYAGLYTAKATRSDDASSAAMLSGAKRIADRLMGSRETGENTFIYEL